jgi:glycosyltransferase 2 family protein
VRVLRRKRFWFGLVVTVAFLAFFLLRTDFDDIWESFAGADYWLAAAAVPLYFIGYAFRALRWRYLLQPIASIPVTRLYPVVIIGLMSNNIAPARIGELVRAYLLGEREKMSKSTAFGTIAIDRAFDGLTLVAILGSVAVLSGTDAGIRSLGIGAALIFLAGTVVLVAMALSPTLVRGWVTRLIALLPGTLAARAESVVDAFLSGLVVIRSPLILLKAAVASLASWLLEAGMYYVVGEAFHLNVGFEVYLMIAAAANLALSVFASPGGVGPFEVTTREVLVYFGVGSAAASAYAIALHALLLVPVILVGLAMIWSSRITLKEILGVSESPERVLPSSGRAD